MFPVGSIKVRLLFASSAVSQMLIAHPSGGYFYFYYRHACKYSPHHCTRGSEMCSREYLRPRVCARCGAVSVIVRASSAHAVHFGTYEAIKELTDGNQQGAASPWLSAIQCVRHGPPLLHAESLWWS